METTKNYFKTKALLIATLLISTIHSFGNDTVKLASAAVTENDKLFEILNYVAMGVGTIAIIWIAYYLSNKSGGDSTSRPKPRIPKFKMRIR